MPCCKILEVSRNTVMSQSRRLVLVGENVQVITATSTIGALAAFRACSIALVIIGQTAPNPKQLINELRQIRSVSIIQLALKRADLILSRSEEKSKLREIVGSMLAPKIT